MSILVNKDSKIICQGITGKAGQRPPRRSPPGAWRDYLDREFRPRETHRAEPAAAGAGPESHEPLDLLAGRVGIGFMVAAFKLGDDPLEGFFINVAAVFLLKKERPLLTWSILKKKKR